MITYQVENLKECIEELKPLLESHYDEIETYKDTIPCDPDYDTYFKYEELGILTLITVRDDKDMVGYYISIETPILNSKKILQSIEIGFYVKEEYRKARIGLELLAYAEEVLINLGVIYMFTSSPISQPCDKLYLKRNMNPYYTQFIKKIG